MNSGRPLATPSSLCPGA